MPSSSGTTVATDTNLSPAPLGIPHGWITVSVVVVITALLPVLGVGPVNLLFLATAMTYVIVLMGLHVVFGLAGQVTLGPAAVFAIGAYGAGIADVTWHLPVSVTILFATALAALAGVIIGLPALRVGGFYLAMVTALAAQAIPVIANIIPSVSGGQNGLIGIIGIGLDRTALGANWTYWSVLIAVAVAGWLMWNVDQSAWGRAFRAVSVNEVAAASMGIAVYRMKIVAFVFSAALGGLAGGIYTHLEQVIDPTQFSFNLSLIFFSALIIGGLARPWGPVLGIAIYVVAPYYVLPSSGGNWVQVGFGAALILVMAVIPGGAAEGLSDAGRATAKPLRYLADRWPGLSERIVISAAAPAVSGAAQTDIAALYSRPDEVQPGQVVLRAVGVHVSFGGIKALQGAGLEVYSGRVTALIGPNGSGKTTLLNACCGHVQVASGAIQLHGQDVTDLPAHRRAALGLSRTFQNPIYLGSLSTMESVMTGCQQLRPPFLSSMVASPGSRRRERAAAARTLYLMQQLGIGALAKPGARASLTDGRLVEVARALTLDPLVLLLDEPAAGLDNDGITALEQVIRQCAAAGVGVLLVDHDVAFVRRVADHVVVLDQGSLIFEGPPADVGQDEGVVSAYLGARIS